MDLPVETTNTTAATSTDAASLPPGGPAILRWTVEQQIVGNRSREKIDPVRKVGRGAHVYPLPIAVHQISPHWTWKGRAMDVDRYMSMDTANVSGVIVLKDGVVLLERYSLGRTAKDRWTSYSVAKSITSILVGAAIQDGYIQGLDDVVTKYIPELEGSAYDGVTIRHLMTMTSGVKWNEDYTDPNSDDAKTWLAPFLDGVDPVVAYMRHLARDHQPGTKFQYKTGDTDLAAILVSTAVGKSASEYLSAKLWQPFGMEKSAYWVVNPAGREYGGGAFVMTLGDYARVGQFMLGGGKAGGVQIVPSDWLAEATRAQMTFPPRPSGWTGYGYFWWISKDSYAAIGYCGQAIIVYPKDKVVIAINSAWSKPNLPEHEEAQAVFVEALHAAAATQPRGPVRNLW